MHDTIAAIATGVGNCGIGVIRISGPDAFVMAGRVFRSTSGGSPEKYSSHTVHYGYIVHPVSEETIDEVLLTVFRAPASFTGEDVAEISCHGGAITLRRAIESCFAAGTRPAEPGEFTKRAFLNGRLDLSQAEAVNDMIRARTDEAQRLALRQLGGALSSRISPLIDSVLSILAQVEASVDFPEDVDEPDCHAVASEIEGIISEIDNLIESSDRGRVYREGISLAIVGRPNVGKSSLLNALLRQARAIVTPIPGTTRDVIEETINIRGIPVVAADTAGLRSSADEVERIGIDLAEQRMAAASIILVVLNAEEGLTDEDRDIISRIGPSTLIVLNKIDVVSDDLRDAKVREIMEEFSSARVCLVSASTGLGIEELEDTIADVVLARRVGPESPIFVTNARHKQALSTARDSLSNVLSSMEERMPVDLLSVDLVGARMALGEITGDTASEDLIDRIFGEFCIGK